ncbi:hypothetical protein [Methyloligella solikamskensis]|uniref:Apea-like HEPN domain-containing protein n=1 Tax=Methyloligella solikamskensis TaxID=1177756 RepID=A0ABW3J5M1_9HYPH
MTSDSKSGSSETVAWLQSTLPDFAKLTGDDIEAATDFLLLWSVFELQALDGNASVNTISEFARRVSDGGKVDANVIQKAAHYFRQRYFEDGDFTNAFHELYARDDKGKSMVEQFLSAAQFSPDDSLQANLLITYRLKNNFVHGSKMAYGLAGQFENFRHANAVIKAALNAIY